MNASRDYLKNEGEGNSRCPVLQAEGDELRRHRESETGSRRFRGERAGEDVSVEVEREFYHARECCSEGGDVLGERNSGEGEGSEGRQCHREHGDSVELKFEGMKGQLGYRKEVIEKRCQS